MDWNNLNTDRDASSLGPIEYDQTKVPALIRKHADNVRTKTYGQEVREAQARNAEIAGLIASEAVDISNETKERQDTIETQFNSVQQELTDKDPISAPEIIAARNGEETLSDRLESDKQEIDEQFVKTKELLQTDYIIEYSPLIDDYGALVNEFTSVNRGAVIKFHAGHVYPVKTTILTGMNHIDFNWSTIESHVENGYAIEMQAVDSLSNLILAKKAGIVGNGILVKSRDHVINGLISKNHKFNIFFKFEDAWDCQFNSIRVDMDVETRTGTFIVSDHSVNNQFNNLNVGYAGLFAHFTTNRHPDKGYGSEGWFFNNTSVLAFVNGIKGDLITHLSLSPTFMFDLASGWFARFTLGDSFRMSGCWIASSFSNTDSKFLISVTSDFGSNVSITENTLINTGVKTDIDAFSVSGDKTIQNNNVKKMNGGNTFGKGVYGNTYTNGYVKSLVERRREITAEGSSVIKIGERNHPFEITVYEKNVDNRVLVLKGIYHTGLTTPTVTQISNTIEGGLTVAGRNNLGNIVIGGFTTESNLVYKLTYENI